MSASRLAKTLFVAALIAAGVAGAAHARDQVFTAKLVEPVAEATQVIAQNTLWSCEGDTCRALVRHSATVRACRQLVRETGALAQYGPEGDALTAEELGRCNAYAPRMEQAQRD